MVAVDIFNVSNWNTPDVYQQTFSPTVINPTGYLNPLSITAARFARFSVTFDF